jgi:transposase
MGDFSDFQTGQFVGAHLAGASVTKMATLLGVPRAAVSKVMMTYTNHGRTSPAKRNSGRKPKLSERDHRILKRIIAINNRNTAAKVTAERNIHLEDRSYKYSLMRLSQIQHPW